MYVTHVTLQRSHLTLHLLYVGEKCMIPLADCLICALAPSSVSVEAILTLKPLLHVTDLLLALAPSAVSAEPK